MAEAKLAAGVLVSGVGEILKKLIFMATEEIGLVWNVKEELKKLVRTVTAIQALVHDAEKQQEEKETVRLFLRRLRDVAYAAEDVLDEFGYQTTRLQVTNKVSKFFLQYSISVAFKLKMAHKIQKINMDFDEIKSYMDSFHFASASTPMNLQNRKTMETFSFVDESEVVGRDDEKSELVSMLTNSNHEDILSVLPIVGMGGLGKTTLAKYVYNDCIVAKYFDTRTWVHVSKDFDVKKILTEITESVTNEPCQISSIDVILRNLKDELDEKRFLLVLDDIWNEDNEQWDMLMSSLKIGIRGSKIIATTRMIEIASMIGTFATHHLNPLSEDKCWSILKNKAFGNRGAEETPNMVAIGKKIVQKCGGVPLAEKTLGGLMHIKKSEQEWLSIMNSPIWTLPMDKDGILPALKLSYDHLPSSLKQCFLYCSVYPKGTYILKMDLIAKWIALGFLQQSTGGRLMEDIGNDYINHLLWNSFFQVFKKNADGDIIALKMHDLIYDLAYSLSKFDNLAIGIEDLKNNPTLIHSILYTDGDKGKIQVDHLYKAGNLRSFHLRCTRAGTSICRDILDILFKKLKHIRVLNLSSCGIQELPSSIKKLKHLRYLDLNDNPIEALPASTTSLYNLRTLKLLNCQIKELPHDMKKLVNLRHLLVSRKDGFLSQMPIEMGRLTSLNTLLEFVVGHKRGQRIKELQHLNLQDSLLINNLENVRSGGEAKEANLMGKEKLDSLHLSWRSHVMGGDSTSMLENDNKKTVVDEDDVLEGLRPHPNLKDLIISNFGGKNIPRWLRSGCESFLPNLVRFSLENCERLEHVPALGQLPSLKSLKLKGMKRMKSLGSELYCGNDSNSQASLTKTAFPSLEEISLLHLPSLEEWMEPQGSFPSFPRLERIFVHDCPKLMIMPRQFPSLKLFQIKRSNGSLQRMVVEVPSVIKLYLIEVPELKFLTLHNNTEILHIEKCPDLEAIITTSEDEGVQVLPSSLEILAVTDCPSLTSLPDLRGLHSIQKFYFLGNVKITRLPEGLHTLHALEVLSIGGFSSELEFFPDLEPLQHLPSLRQLHIEGWSKLTSLPEQLQSLTQLEWLGIYKFNSVAALPEWLGNLSSLRTLLLKECNNLMYLPKEEGGLRCLITLESLSIRDCPFLKERCTRGRGDEWPKIKHIKSIFIDDQRV
ncbi:putative disease resistance protein RGA3 [Macadamia integrifolia]|uniref:putative disease resistance protein RGA3 n=1 Tax=Macadamia integrifolia TaxID=60698 RepID=UPI001C527E27|nr:putative disease resistance protein RGA3 [Macadamia integrifolia]XP_042481073.1 putative disease resistance protein RGA3 [Macadamia integrifolia]XP_042481074.1 putative disease resistance protein RGA3 [Macadamia integrifolia]XP_042481075.1 putative disease resistance protein RGA3 [Macadamia integrifolia]XP_042481076.1 putative disease resistance protein RGA3 [Macadamia integrifolia]XP_042481077.1 putative disease resistance protein RGA3 [Macadamia integrifolia]XP_042481078.1 putative disea